MRRADRVDAEVLRVGVLGAASIAPAAVVRPSRGHPMVEVVAVAARDPRRAAEFARKHRIPRAHTSYQTLVEDPEIDAVYVALPAALHGTWTRAALASGKHVLCEKPFAANARDAAGMVAASQANGRVLMEAFHYRYHAVARRLLELVDSGEIGSIRRMYSAFCLPLVNRRNIRWNLDLGGGAFMDLGCYPVHLLRTLARSEPDVVSAEASVRGAGVDRVMRAELCFDGDVPATVTASMLSRRLFAGEVVIEGRRGRIRVANPFQPAIYHRIEVSAGDERRVERLARRPSTYAAQLDAFARATLLGEPVLTGGHDAVATMRVIDDCYRAAGLQPRSPATS